MTLQRTFIEKKLDDITQYRKELGELLNNYSDKEIFADHTKLHTIERLTQLIVDLMIDINQHFIRELNLELPDDLRGTFAILGESKILPKDFADKVAPLAGVRNMLVHQYEKIDKDLLMNNVRKNFSDFEKYQKYTYEYLRKNIRTNPKTL